MLQPADDRARESLGGAEDGSIGGLEFATQELLATLRAIAQRKESGQRAEHRRRLERAMSEVARTLTCAEAALGTEPLARPAFERNAQRSRLRRARATLAKAHAEKAEDALHGAGQLSLSAQRAPTQAACDAGWQRAAELTAGTEASAQAAASLAAELERDASDSAPAKAARRAAVRAEAAAARARQLLADRNDAYTFHTDPRFSFGEGWYLAAAAVLAGVRIQIEPDTEATAGAERFLRAAGLGPQLQPYRPRPRAMKHTTHIVGDAFRRDPRDAQQRVRSAFLGGASVPDAIRRWVDQRFSPAHASSSKVLLWIRDGRHHANRNTDLPELRALTLRAESAALVPIWIGDSVGREPLPAGVIDMVLFWKDPLFRGEDMRRAQLHFFEHLKQSHGLVGQVGVTTAGMDGPALMGLPTLYLTDAPNVRMREWVGAVPGYEEVVRGPGYLERVSQKLSLWSCR